METRFGRWISTRFGRHADHSFQREKGCSRYCLLRSTCSASKPALLILGIMVRTNPTFMDDPSKPPKPFRDVLARRRKRQQDAITKELTPVLTRSFAEYCSSGQAMPSSTVTLRRAELGAVLEKALDGEYSGEPICAYCVAVTKTLERSHEGGVDQVTTALHTAGRRALPAPARQRHRWPSTPWRTPCADVPPLTPARVLSPALSHARRVQPSWQEPSKKAPSCSHHLLCMESKRLHIDRRTARATMRVEIERISRLATEVLTTRLQSQPDMRGVVVVQKESEESALVGVIFENDPDSIRARAPTTAITTLPTLPTTAVVTKHFSLFRSLPSPREGIGVERDTQPSASGGTSGKSTVNEAQQPTAELERVEESTAVRAAVEESAAVRAAVAEHVAKQESMYAALVHMHSHT